MSDARAIRNTCGTLTRVSVATGRRSRRPKSRAASKPPPAPAALIAANDGSQPSQPAKSAMDSMAIQNGGTESTASIAVSSGRSLPR